MKLKLLFIPFAVFLISCSTQSKFDVITETKAILDLHKLQRDYHFNKDSISFANQLSENFISINRGIITRPKKDETIKKYHNYFSSVEFVKWDDVSEPIIRFSNNGTIAYTVVDKVVVTISIGENGIKINNSTHFAWNAIYKKYDNEWKIDCITSTERPLANNG